MARGDAVIDIINVSASSTSTVQPASGEEWIIKSFGDALQGSTSRIQYYDGTLTSHVAAGDKSQVTCGVVSLVVDNTNYFQLRNAAGGSAYPLAYGGFKTKDE
tara:strand:+ start:75 stop:383 length:309 start_codon:yes stop_codon:yes gene_type:complete